MLEKTETFVPCIIEDFEVGDRVYRIHDKDGVRLGRVTKAQGKTISVIMDTGEIKKANLSSFQREHGNLWGKALDLADLKIGDRVSCWGKSGRRTFATVLRMVPDESVTLALEITYDDHPTEKSVQTYTNKNRSLAWWFAQWEKEG